MIRVAYLLLFMKANGLPSLFRYDVKPKNKVSCIEPTVPDGDTQNLRATMLGAVVKGHFLNLPRSNMGSILWEASCQIFE